MKTENYPSWLVPLEIAKKLKEIGFDLPCAFVLTNKGRIGFTTRENNQHHLFEELDLNSNSKGSLVRIPTYEQVIEWFVSVGIFGNVRISSYEAYQCDYMGVGEVFYAEVTNWLGDEYQIPYKPYRVTYQEAREDLVEAMIYCYKYEEEEKKKYQQEIKDELEKKVRNVKRNKK